MELNFSSPDWLRFFLTSCSHLVLCLWRFSVAVIVLVSKTSPVALIQLSRILTRSWFFLKEKVKGGKKKKPRQKCWHCNTGAAAFVCTVWVGARGRARVQSVCHNLFSCLLIFLDISYFQLERLLRFPRHWLNRRLCWLLLCCSFWTRSHSVPSSLCARVEKFRHCISARDTPKDVCQKITVFLGGLWEDVYIGCLDCISEIT